MRVGTAISTGAGWYELESAAVDEPDELFVEESLDPTGGTVTRMGGAVTTVAFASSASMVASTDASAG